jgi:hypothetical protein
MIQFCKREYPEFAAEIKVNDMTSLLQFNEPSFSFFLRPCLAFVTALDRRSEDEGITQGI